jgi:hypothetical protein
MARQASSVASGIAAVGTVTTSIQFRWRAFDTYSAPPGARVDPVIVFFDGSGPTADEKVTDRSERQIVDWLVGLQPARELLLEELELPPGIVERGGSP